MAVDLQLESPEIAVQSPRAGNGTRRPMLKENQVRFVAAIVGLLTAAAIVFAFINFQKEREFETPTDGVWWIESGGHLKAEKVEADGPGDKAGIKQGDILVALNGVDITRKATQVRQIYRTGNWSKANYSLVRDNVPVEVPLILVPADRSLNGGLRLIALIYLGIGMYVLFRRWTAPKATHFYLFCLVSFIHYSFHFTGKLNQFDWIIYWSNVTAWLVQPALFLHFSLTFPETKEVVKKHRWLVPLVYALPAAMLAFHITALNFLRPSEILRWNLDRAQMLYLTVYFIAATIVLWQTYSQATSPILRQQMKWVTRGTFLAIAPFTIFYVIPYLNGSVPGPAMKVSVLSLIFLPLTFGYAIFRYRLMDVDLIFKRGMAYTLAAGTITGIYFVAIGAASEMFHKNFPSAGPAGLIAAIVVTALLFDPFKNWIQDKLDKFFYRKRYDYRKTLIEFGRDLNSETDLDKMLSAIVDRISRTLLVDRIGVFVHDEAGRWTLGKSCGISHTQLLDMSFLDAERPDMEAAGHLFFDNTSQAVRESPSARETIRRLDLNYYLPCTVMNRTIAMIGLGKTTEGDFLSSEDVELLETLAGYIGIALQNARLYHSLAEKIAEYERLKEFNENIVESVSVGVLAVDLEDKIESWNAQMEVMYALPRAEALGKRLSDVFPVSFLEEFYRVRQIPGINNLYKFRIGTPAGDTRICNIAIAPLVTREFNVIGRIIILDDMTDRVELESQLAQAEKLSSIGLLAAGVAHEVNTPLAVISSYAQMLSKQLQGDERRSALMEKITTQTFRASEIVNNLLNFSRTGSSEFTEVDINKIVTDTLALLEHQFKTSRVKVEHNLESALPRIFGNTGKLQQVFLNLFLNAKDAMPAGGTLSITTMNGRSVQVEVRDTGSGIAPEHIQKIYDPFFTTKKSPRQGHSGGTGLGLAVTYGIIQEHAGKIRVDSRPGEGTLFTMEFPMVRKAVNA